MDHALNWLGQGSLVALATAVLLAMTRRVPARLRYRVAALALGAIVLLPLLSVRAFWQPQADTTSAVMTATPVLVSLPDGWWTSDRLVLGLWGAWVIAVGVRTIIGLVTLTSARTACRPFPAAIEAGLPQWLARPESRRARLMVSDVVHGAAVLPGRTPFIAVNPSLVQSLDAVDLDRVVMHEWAHVERRDDLAVFPQLAAHLVAGWHPAAWWLDRRLHFEREVACDERVVRLFGSPKDYAQCLATLASLSPAPTRALPAVGASPGSNLRQRVGRILHVPHTPSRLVRAVIAVASFIPVTVAASIADLRMVGDMPAVLIAQGATAVEVPDTQNEPSGPSAGGVSDATPSARLGVRPLSRQSDEGGRRIRVTAGEESTGDVATAVMTNADGPGPGSDMPIIPALASAVSWSFTTLPGSAAVAPTAGISEHVTPPPDTPTLWGAAATGGVAIGRSSQKAAVSTAGFFTRVGKSIAGSF